MKGNPEKIITEKIITEEIRTLADCLRRRRRALDATQHEVCEIMGVSMSTVAQYERLLRVPDAQACAAWEKAIVKLEKAARRRA